MSGPILTRVLSPIGGLLVGLGVFIPYADIDGSSLQILDFDNLSSATSIGFALEPLAVALVSLAPLVLFGSAPRLAAIVVATAGAQTALFYLGYLIYAIDVYDPHVGGFLGLAGSIAMLVAGVLGLTLAAPRAYGMTSYSPTPEPAPATTLPPGGWYADPTGQAGERFWDGTTWTEATR